jgi:hypothetical protein
MRFSAISRLSERPGMRRGHRVRSSGTRLLLPGLIIVLLLGGCGGFMENAAATRTVVSSSPIATHTPTGDLLLIDGEPVRRVLIPDPSHGALYALTDAELYRYQRGHWEPTGARNDGRHLLVDPNDTERILRGDHPVCGVTSTGDPIRFDISEDRGRFWRVLFQGANIRPMLFDRTLPGIVYGSDCGLAISSTRGLTWNRFQVFDGFDLIALEATGERLYVIGVSKDGVSQLRAINVTDPENPIAGDPLLEVSGNATLDVRGGRIIVGALDAVYMSDDAGVNWAKSRIGLEQVTGPPTIPPERAPGGGPDVERGIQVIHIDPGNIHRLYAGTPHGLYVSQDDGLTWVRYTQISIDANVIDIQFALNGADLYVTTTTGVVVVPRP